MAEEQVGTLANDGVGLADVADGAIPSEIVDELEDVRKGIIDGTIDSGWGDLPVRSVSRLWFWRNGA